MKLFAYRLANGLLNLYATHRVRLCMPKMAISPVDRAGEATIFIVNWSEEPSVTRQ